MSGGERLFASGIMSGQESATLIVEAESSPDIAGPEQAM